jgi:hypothetical protein
VASREAHDLHEGKALKEAVQERLRYEIRPWNSVNAKTAERLRKPESGPVESVDSSRHALGLRPRMPLKGAKAIGKVGSGH